MEPDLSAESQPASQTDRHRLSVESPPSFGAEKVTPLPLACLDASLLSLQPSSAATADTANFFHGLRTAVLVSAIAYDCAGSADAEPAAAQAAELLTAELCDLTARRCVRERPADECPVCMEPYDEGPGCYPSARAAGAFECEHSLCFGCSRKLLITAAGAGAERASLVFRCPLCRANGCLDRADPNPNPEP
jgi:hypothetical protein